MSENGEVDNNFLLILLMPYFEGIYRNGLQGDLAILVWNFDKSIDLLVDFDKLVDYRTSATLWSISGKSS